jgi:hypothetical protein
MRINDAEQIIVAAASIESIRGRAERVHFERRRIAVLTPRPWRCGGEFVVTETSGRNGLSPAATNVTAQSVATPRVLSRRRIEIALGFLWLVDGLLQLQPYMFSREFYNGMLGMATMGLPGPVADADYHVATLLTAHPALWNTGFASLQLLLGLGFIWRRTARVALICSVPWAFGVWATGEGFGGMFMPGTSMLTGAPGPALIYALLAVMLLCTATDTTVPGGRIGRTGLRIGAAGWALIWTAGALLELEGTNHAAAVPGAQISNGSSGEPALFRWIDGGSGHLIGQHGYLFALLLGLLAVFAGWGIVVPGLRRACLFTGIVVAAFVGLAGQDLGAVFTGHGTDPGSGPLLTLLALALWPPRNSSKSKQEGSVPIRTRETEVSSCPVGSSSPPQQRSPVPA